MVGLVLCGVVCGEWCVWGACFSVVGGRSGSCFFFMFLMVNMMYRFSFLSPESVEPSLWNVKEI